MAAAIGGGLALGGAVIGAAASKSAAKTQAAATQQAAQLEAATADKQILAQKQAVGQARADVAPWRTAGIGGLNLVQRLLGIEPAGTGNKPLTFDEYKAQGEAAGNVYDDPRDPSMLPALQASYDQYKANFAANAPPTAAGGGVSPEEVMKLDPGYQFRLNEGGRAIDMASAAKRGPGLSGATLKELTRYGQDYASGEFQNVFNRASTLSGTGLGAATGQAQFTQAGASNQANIATNAATNQSNLITGGANATAAGTVGAANAGVSALNNIGQQLTLANIFGNSGTPAPVSSNENATLLQGGSPGMAPVYTV